ncbi:MAG TPA: RNA methyltransferase [Thermoanaerobaculia bacterium]|nr:RNA methyltransferase [Thermoanaerobaculia bacterium]
MPTRPSDLISSRENRWFRRFLDAARTHREEILLEGPKQIADALERGWSPLAFAIADGDAPSAAAPAFRFAPALIRELTDARHPQGVLALFERPGSSLEDALAAARLVVVLDGVQDPGNVGAIIRTAAAFGASAVLLTEGCADPLAPKALRASAGTALLLPVVDVARAGLAAEIERRSIRLYAAAADGDAQRIELPAAIVFGSEGRGVSEELLARSRAISIPISPSVESLNVAAAAAILIHAALRGQS